MAATASLATLPAVLEYSCSGELPKNDEPSGSCKQNWYALGSFSWKEEQGLSMQQQQVQNPQMHVQKDS